MNRIVALVRWFCRQLSFDELLTATVIILEVLNHDRPDILCKDAFRQAHPNYRKYAVDPNPPLTECPAPKQSQPSADWKTLLVQYRQRTDKDLPPVHRRHGANAVPSSTRCPHCNAPASYLYFNDGKKNTPNSSVKSACPSLSLRLTADQAIIPYFGVPTVAPPCIAGKTLLSSQSTSAQTTVAPLSSQPVSNSMPKNASFKLKNPASSNSVTSTASTTSTLNPLSPPHPRPTTSAVLTASKALPTPLALSSRSVFLMA